MLVEALADFVGLEVGQQVPKTNAMGHESASKLVATNPCYCKAANSIGVKPPVNLKEFNE